MGNPEWNIAWVYNNEDNTKLITADFPIWTNLEKELNLDEQCKVNAKLDSLESTCKQREQQIDATLLVMRLQGNLETSEIFDDIDLVYDPKLDTYRYRLYDQNDLIIPINLDLSDTHDTDLKMSKLEKFGEIIVELMNNIEELEFVTEEWNISFQEMNGYQEITSPRDNIISNILPNKHIVSTESLKEIFYFNPNEEYPDVQANNILNTIKNTIQQAQEYRKKLAWNWIEAE